MTRKKAYDKLFDANTLCIAGLLVMPALLFNPSTEYRVFQFLFFWFLVWLSGKKTSFLFTMLVITGIVAFNLIIPYGKVIFSFGPLKITSGALTAGIHRAVTFEALIMLSKVSIRHDLRLPGAFGELLGESLRIFSAMMTRKRSVTGKRKNLISKIDAILMGVENAELPETENQERKTMPAGYVILAFVVILCWLPLFI